MPEIIYTKISNDRAPEFGVITQIEKQLDGSLLVWKKPAGEASIQHTENIVCNYRLLSEKYKRTPVRFAKAIQKEDGILLEYVSGQSFEHCLTSHLKEGKERAAERLIDDYLNAFLTEQEPFVLSSGYEAVFGRNVPEEHAMAVRNVDVDMLFANVIYQDGLWMNYDYEWTFGFPIPVKYLIYRVFLYFRDGHPERNTFVTHLLEKYQIGEEAVYLEMEECFQKHVYGKTVPMWKLYTSMHGLVYDVKSIFGKSEFIQVFFDYGKGMTENDSIRCPVEQRKELIFRGSFTVPSGVRKFRIDPMEKRCVLQIRILQNEKQEDLPYITNGDLVNGFFVYLHNDPQIVVELNGVSAREVHMEIMISTIYTESPHVNPVLDSYAAKYTRRELLSVKQKNQYAELSEAYAVLSEEKEAMEKDLIQKTEQLERIHRLKVYSVYSRWKKFKNGMKNKDKAKEQNEG